MQKPTIGRIVVYRSRTGNYDVPALVTCTVDTLAEVGVERFIETDGREGVPPLSSDQHVHLSVHTPGLPGLRVEAQDFKVTSDFPRQENRNGVYQEWDIPFAGEIPASAIDVGPGTWRWPERV